MEFGENIEDALKRELKEELSVAVEIVELLGVTDHILPHAGVYWVSPVFLVRIISGTPKNVEGDKQSDLRWFGLDDLPDDVALTTRRTVELLASRGAG